MKFGSQIIKTFSEFVNENKLLNSEMTFLNQRLSAR